MLDLNLDDNVLLEEEIEFLRNLQEVKKKIKEEFIERMPKATGGLIKGEDVPLLKKTQQIELTLLQDNLTQHRWRN
ncbi:MAG: hypothetical protein CM15mV82_220 [uncultured marine virus]|nr:MAG: hypothetical protein CM15mV82_220 [uncultured marine virus]